MWKRNKEKEKEKEKEQEKIEIREKVQESRETELYTRGESVSFTLALLLCCIVL
jgi:hypothetical protein